jgi:hypothetical protein
MITKAALCLLVMEIKFYMTANTIGGWAQYTINRPVESGYYMTYYYNTEQKQCLYKALYYSTTKNEFVFRIKDVDQHVIAYVPSSRNDYYIPCMISYQENKSRTSCPFGAKENNNETESYLHRRTD